MEPRTLTLEDKTPKVFPIRKKWIKWCVLGVALLFFSIILSKNVFAAPVTFSIDTGDGGGDLDSLKLLFTFVLIAVAPFLLLMVTSFTRIVIVFSFLRNALGLQQTPPNQVLIGIALFLSFFIMHPVLTDINQTAIQPYSDGEITQEECIDNVQIPLKEFMLKQTKTQDLNLFLSLSDKDEITEVNTQQLKDLGLEVIVPSFMTSELKRAFMIGFLLFLPFLVIDMIVASTLMSMGMVMLPPSMISLPFKLMLFVVVDGWSLIMEMLIKSFY